MGLITQEIYRTPPSFLFVDLDLASFDNNKNLLDKVLNKTQKKITKKIKGNPTILWSGGGYHIYQPTKFVISKEAEEQGFSTTLESIERFSRFLPFIDYDLTSEFMRFAESFFTNKRNDLKHKPSINSCLIRIPGTINSKYGTEVKIIQKWDGMFSPINYILKDFEIHLIQNRIKAIQKNEQKSKKLRKYRLKANSFRYDRFQWIEQLIETPIGDHRKYCLWRILLPYLVNVKRISETEVISILTNWLDKCNQLKKVDFSYPKKIELDLKYVRDYLPISLEKLKDENIDLYRMNESRRLRAT